MPNHRRKGVRLRSIGIHDDLWAAARARADERGEAVSEAVRRFLTRYAKEK